MATVREIIEGILKSRIPNPESELINALVNAATISQLTVVGPSADDDHTLLTLSAGGQTIVLRYSDASNAIQLGLSGSGVFSLIANGNAQINIVDGSVFVTSSALRLTTGALQLPDGITAPATAAGFASLYVDSADGDLKCRFGDGTIKTISTDT